MPRDMSGVYTIPAGTLSPAVGGTVISADDWNDFILDLEQAITDSMVTGATVFTGAAEFDPGSSANPGIFFTGDPDSGFFHPGANQIGITVNGGNTSVIATFTETQAIIDGALNVTGNADIDTNLNVDGTLTVDGLVTASAGITCNAQKIASVLDPTADQDAATKKYVDDSLGGITTAWTQPTAAANAVTTNLRVRKVNGTAQFNGYVTFTGVVAAGADIAVTGPAPYSVVGAGYVSMLLPVVWFSSITSLYSIELMEFTESGGVLNIRNFALIGGLAATDTLYFNTASYYAG